MPGFNGTGPAGMGPMTGWGQGYCNPSRIPYGPAPTLGSGYWSGAYGLGFGRGRGFSRGRGFGRGFRPGSGWGRGYGRSLSRGRAYPAWGAW